MSSGRGVLMSVVKLWNKKLNRFYVSGKGRDSWGSTGTIKGVMKTSYFPDYNCEEADYEFVTFELVETCREPLNEA